MADVTIYRCRKRKNEKVSGREIPGIMNPLYKSTRIFQVGAALVESTGKTVNKNRIKIISGYSLCEPSCKYRGLCITVILKAFSLAFPDVWDIYREPL
jgi:hypothetical protein